MKNINSLIALLCQPQHEIGCYNTLVAAWQHSNGVTLTPDELERVEETVGEHWQTVRLERAFDRAASNSSGRYYGND